MHQRSELCLSARHRAWRAPEVSNELLTPAELAAFGLRYGALLWLIAEQHLRLSPDGRLRSGKTLEASLGASFILNV